MAAEKTKKEIIFDFMTKNPEFGFAQLQEAFSDMNLNSLRAYFSAWNNKQRGGKPKRLKSAKLAISSKDQKLILAFKKLIERQEQVIETQKEKLTDLRKEIRESESKLYETMDGLTSKQKKTVLQMVEVYVAGLKSQ